MGDAAHGIVPFFGQGMNCGFEDASVFYRLLKSKDQLRGWHQIFRDFFDERKKNTDAIADLASENFIEMRDKVADRDFLFVKSVERRLMQEFRNYISRYQLVSFTNIPYQKAQKVGRIQDEILSELCRGLHSAEQVDLGRAKKLIEAKLVEEYREFQY
jgi:kynurenine 3-monooxygenase